MGSDGVWDYIDNDFAVNFVYYQMMIQKDKTLKEILLDLLKIVQQKAKNLSNPMDNATITCIVFKRGKILEEVVEDLKMASLLQCCSLFY